MLASNNEAHSKLKCASFLSVLANLSFLGNYMVVFRALIQLFLVITHKISINLHKIILT